MRVQTLTFYAWSDSVFSRKAFLTTLWSKSLTSRISHIVNIYFVICNNLHTLEKQNSNLIVSSDHVSENGRFAWQICNLEKERELLTQQMWMCVDPSFFVYTKHSRLLYKEVMLTLKSVASLDLSKGLCLSPPRALKTIPPQ